MYRIAFIALILLLVIIPARIFAQLCVGSVGDPIVNISFGKGSNYGPPLSSSTTNLRYQPVNCPADGYYSIANYTSGCWPNDVVWHTATDNTGDGNGYFMLVNASYEPSDFYLQTIRGLCEGVSYRFSVALLNMCSVSGILPDLTLSIERTDGTVLTQYNTGSIPITRPLKWENYGFNFTTPPGVSDLVLRMRNNAPGGVGNDVGLDDIIFRPIGPSVTIQVPNAPGSLITQCLNQQQALNIISQVESCYTNPYYQWQLSTDSGITWVDIEGETGTEFLRSPTGAGFYRYRLLVASEENIASSSCRIASNPIDVLILANPKPDLGEDLSFCSGDSILLDAGIFGSYTWNTGTTERTLIVTEPGIYRVIVSGSCGSASDEVIVKEISCSPKFPNAFTPNNDGHNDEFKALHLPRLTTFRLQVFNRWGQRVFESTNPTEGWNGLLNGKGLSTGTYVWHCMYTAESTGIMSSARGTVLLIR